MKAKEEKHLVLRLIEYGESHTEFYLKTMFDDLGLDENDSNYVFKNLVCTTKDPNPNAIIKTVATVNPHGHKKQEHIVVENVCRILPTALFSYIDHLEIVEARKAAKEAKRLSWIAIAVSVILTSLQIIFGK